MHAAHEPDELLMAQVASGQRERLEPLVRRHAGPLLSFLSRMVRDRHRCEELFQDVFLAVWVERHQYQQGRPFKPWLYAIAANKCHEAARRRKLSAVEYDDEKYIAHGVDWVAGSTGELCGIDGEQ